MKEHAYIYDLYIVPYWRHLFEGLYREHLKMPSEGRVLELNCGTGSFALELAASLGERGEVLALDAAALVELAEAKRSVTKQKNIFFRPISELESIGGDFDLIIIDLTLLDNTPLLQTLKLLRKGGNLVVKYLSRGSFDEFYSVFWEALFACGMSDKYLCRLENLIYRYRTIEEFELYLKSMQMRSIKNYQQKQRFVFESSNDFFNSPIISGYFMDGWLSILEPEAVPQVSQSLRQVIDHDGAFEISIKANLITCKRD